MQPKDWALLVIGAAENRGLSPVQLQKVLFLLQRKFPADRLGESFYNFIPYNYGPFDVQIYYDAEKLEKEGLISITPSAEHRWKTYRVAPAGLRLASELRSEAPASVLEYLDYVVRWVRGLSFRELVSAIYAEYPEFRVNSVFQE